ncbi:MAG TPA: hypothetical protein DCG39_00515 [Opitutae bacterium]|nr:hypothetical protein [Opitutae bacterium]
MKILDPGLRSFLTVSALRDEPTQRLAVFRTDEGITLSFGEHTYFVESSDPFHNIALKALDQEDFVPFYVEIARREGLGPKFRDALMRQVSDLSGEED